MNPVSQGLFQHQQSMVRCRSVHGPEPSTGQSVVTQAHNRGVNVTDASTAIMPKNGLFSMQRTSCCERVAQIVVGLLSFGQVTGAGRTDSPIDDEDFYLEGSGSGLGSEVSMNCGVVTDFASSAATMLINNDESGAGEEVEGIFSALAVPVGAAVGGAFLVGGAVIGGKVLYSKFVNQESGKSATTTFDDPKACVRIDIPGFKGEPV